MFREPEGEKVVEMDRLAVYPTDTDEVNMDVQKGSGAKDTSGPLSSTNPPILLAAPKTLSSNMDSRFFCEPKHPPLHNQMFTRQCH